MNKFQNDKQLVFVLGVVLGWVAFSEIAYTWFRYFSLPQPVMSSSVFVPLGSGFFALLVSRSSYAKAKKTQLLYVVLSVILGSILFAEPFSQLELFWLGKSYAIVQTGRLLSLFLLVLPAWLLAESTSLPRKLPAALLGAVIGAWVGWLVGGYQLRKLLVWLGLAFDVAKMLSPCFAGWLALFPSFAIGWLLSPFVSFASSTKIVTPWGLILSVLAVVLWFVPMAITGSFNTSLYSFPAPLRNQYRIACLFTHASSNWPTVHYEILQNDVWVEGPLEGFFELDIFGYRTKLNRIVLASRKKNKKTGKLLGKNHKRLQEIANFIGKRWARNYPQEPPVRKVRFTIARHPVGEAHCMAKESWSRPLLKNIPNKHKRKVGSFLVRNR